MRNLLGLNIFGLLMKLGSLIMYERFATKTDPLGKLNPWTVVGAVVVCGTDMGPTQDRRCTSAMVA